MQQVARRPVLKDPDVFMSAFVIGGENKKGEEKKGENVKEKGKKRQDIGKNQVKKATN
jgi:hypothetical protein